MKSTQTLIIGGGQAGLSLSRHLTTAGHPHVVLERGRIGERWRSERWRSLTLLTPNWLNQLDGGTRHADRSGFLHRQAFVDYLDAYALSFAAPVREQTAVTSVSSTSNGFRVETTDGSWGATNVVIATGDCDIPRMPAVAEQAPSRVLQVHSSEYRSPAELPEGGVLVVGAGPSGMQIAAELRRAGRDVVLAAGAHATAPRTYRGRDIFSWLELIGELEETIDEVDDRAAAARAPGLTVSGRNGGERLDLRILVELGIEPTGRLESFDGPRAQFADDLLETSRMTDEKERALLARIDERIEASDIEAPRDAGDAQGDGSQLTPGPRTVDLDAGFGAIVWATGYRRSYPWLELPALDASGELIQHHGHTPIRGLYTLGMRFQRRRASHFIGGVGRDAAYVAQAIVTSRTRELERQLRGGDAHGADAVPSGSPHDRAAAALLARGPSFAAA